MRSWFAAHWTPDDLPGLRLLVRLYDDHERGKHVGSELRLVMDTYGVTPKGQQDRRWTPPEKDEAAREETDSPYGYLRVAQ